MDSHIAKTLGDFATRLTEMEQNFSTLTARLCKVETYAASASNISGSARSWPSLEQVEGSTAAGSHGPGSSSENRNTRRSLDISPNPDDEQSRSAVLLRFPCEQYHKRITKWINNVCEESNMPADRRPVTIVVKQVPCRSGLFLNHEANVKTLLLDIKMMVFLMRLTVPFAVSKQLLLSANPDQSRTEKSASNLYPCGGCWLTNLNFSSLMEMTKVLLSSQPSTLAQRSSALKIEETGLENLCSNLPLLDMDNCLPLLHLTCVFLVFLVKCCNGFSLKPTRSMCDGRPFASSPFCRLACRGALFQGFPFRWVLHFVLSLTRGVLVHNAASCLREDSLDECGRPCDTLSCFLFSSLLPRCNQSILVQETQSAKDTDMTCSKMLLIKATFCLHLGPVSLDWPVDHFARFDFSRSSLSPEGPSDDQQRGANPASTRSRWRQNTLQAPPQVLQRIAGWDGCALSSPEVCGVLLGTPGVSLDLFSLSRKAGNSSSNTSKSYFSNNNIICLHEVHGKDEYLQALHLWPISLRLSCLSV